MTDANLVLGHLDSEHPLAGGVALDLEAARAAVGSLASTLRLSPEECASGIRRVTCAEMAGALRVVTVDRGVDPRDYTLLAFGGAGPLHATEIAEQLGIERVLVPSASGVLAALGLVVSPRRRDAQRSVLLSGAALDEERVATEVRVLAERSRGALGEPEAQIEAVYDLRYRGQSFELPVRAGLSPRATELREAFDAEHRLRYGYADPEAEVELVTIRVSTSARGVDVALGAAAGLQAPGGQLRSPATVRLPTSTLVIPADWSGSVDGAGSIHLERSR